MFARIASASLRASIGALSASARASAKSSLRFSSKVFSRISCCRAVSWAACASASLTICSARSRASAMSSFARGSASLVTSLCSFVFNSAASSRAFLQDGLRLGLGLRDDFLASLLEVLGQDLFLPGLHLRRFCLGVLDDLLGLGLRLGEEVLCLWLDLLRFCLGVLDDLLGLGLRLGEEVLCLWLDLLRFCLGVLDDLLGLGLRLGEKLLRLLLDFLCQVSLLLALETGRLFPGLFRDRLRLGPGALDFLPGGLQLWSARLSASCRAAFTISSARALAWAKISFDCSSAPSTLAAGPMALASARALSRICSALAFVSAMSFSASERYSSRIRAATSSRFVVASRTISSALAFAWATVLL